jgi:hypothetical protein
MGEIRRLVDRGTHHRDEPLDLSFRDAPSVETTSAVLVWFAAPPWLHGANETPRGGSVAQVYSAYVVYTLRHADELYIHQCPADL